MLCLHSTSIAERLLLWPKHVTRLYWNELLMQRQQQEQHQCVNALPQFVSEKLIRHHSHSLCNRNNMDSISIGLSISVIFRYGHGVPISMLIETDARTIEIGCCKQRFFPGSLSLSSTEIADISADLNFYLKRTIYLR